jgi:hypothetical protein
MTLAALYAVMALAEARPPSSPIVAEIHASAPDGAVDVVLVGASARGVLSRDLAHHRDPVSTRLQPRILAGDGEVLELVGYRLARHDQPGDTLVTYTLLCEVSSAASVWVVWYENHQEVPTSLYVGEGTLSAGESGGASRLEVQVARVDVDETLSLSGLVRRP